MSPPGQLQAPFDWLIVGGGIHGVHIAARLLADARVAPEQLRIVDPAGRLLARWRAVTETTGMSHLRSPSVHHLDLDPGSLLDFAGKPRSGKSRLFAPPYDRPALRLFNEHCDWVTQSFELPDLHIQDRVEQCRVDGDNVVVRLSHGRQLTTRHVVLALGVGDQPELPEWAPRGHPRVRHIFEPGFNGWPTSKETVAVVGGGISAGQVGLRLLEEGHRVHLISRHALRQHQFDSDPGWLGPKYMAGFDLEKDYGRRRAMIAEARHRGSVPPDVRQALSQAIAGGQLDWHEGTVERLDATDDSVRLWLNNQTRLQAQRVLLATGFSPHRPGGAMVDGLAASAGLPCAPCGYPIVDSALRWHPRVYVTGALAELELGPSSRNIAGARRAATRLVGAALAAARGRQRPSVRRAPPIPRCNLCEKSKILKIQ